jgi:P-type Ca2+ transporter type 2C
LRTPNKAMGYVFTGTISCLLIVLYIPVLQSLFGFGTVPLEDVLICAVAGASGIIWFECFKFWSTRKRHKYYIRERKN